MKCPICGFISFRSLRKCFSCDTKSEKSISLKDFSDDEVEGFCIFTAPATKTAITEDVEVLEGPNETGSLDSVTKLGNKGFNQVEKTSSANFNLDLSDTTSEVTDNLEKTSTQEPKPPSIHQ